MHAVSSRKNLRFCIILVNIMFENVAARIYPRLLVTDIRPNSWFPTSKAVEISTRISLITFANTAFDKNKLFVLKVCTHLNHNQFASTPAFHQNQRWFTQNRNVASSSVSIFKINSVWFLYDPVRGWFHEQTFVDMKDFCDIYSNFNWKICKLWSYWIELFYCTSFFWEFVVKEFLKNSKALF